MLLGIASGALSGIVGIGGGIVIVPALILFFGFNQLRAQGTTLALLTPPIGILAAYIYYKQGNVDLRAALFICIGFIVGSLIGSRIAVIIPAQVMKKVFGVLLVAVAAKFLFTK